MRRMDTPLVPEISRDEARRELVGYLGERCDEPLAALLTEHLLRIYPDESYALLRDAALALLRRIAKVEEDDLVVRNKPPKGWRGAYATGRRKGSTRPYKTQVLDIEPLRIACDCPDYLHGSLGLCKHGVAVLLHLAGKPRIFKRARESAPLRARAWWYPVRPVSGGLHWSEGVRISATAEISPGFRRHLEPSDDSLDWGEPTLRVAAKPLDYLQSSKFEQQILEPLQSLIGRRRTNDDPALRAWLEREREARRRWGALASNRRARTAALRSFRMKPYPYQLAAIEKFLSTGRLLLADDMGLGKTVQATAIAHLLARRGVISKTLIIAPASLKSQWVREWRRGTDLPIESVDGSMAARHALYEQTHGGALVANYEQLFRDLERMQAWKPELVILDEAQRIKNWTTRTARAVKRLEVPYRLVLTGTPLENRLEELASIMDWVDPYALSPKWRLPAVHAVYADGTRRQVGAKNFEVLRHRLAPSMLRRKRSEILKDLPERTDTVVAVRMTAAQRDEHDALTPDIAKLARIAERRGLTQPQFLRLMSLLTTQRVIANGMAQYNFTETWESVKGRRCTPATRESLGMPKLHHLREIIESVVIEQGRKVVVFSQWRRSLQLAEWSLAGLLAEHGVRLAFFSGNESQARRTNNVVEFHDDPQLRVLLCTDAGGVGLNLQRAANCCVNFDLPWNPAVLEQRVARIHRLGQTDPIDVYNLVSESSIEARILGTLTNKKALFDGLFDGATNEVMFDEGTGFLATVSKLVDTSNVSDGDDELDEASADRRDETPAPASPGAGSLPEPAAVRSMFDQLRVETRPDGGVRLDAPPEAARTLSALFAGMAKLLEESAE